LKVNDENSRIRIRILTKISWIRILVFLLADGMIEEAQKLVDSTDPDPGTLL
jgi:hypothetical protein